MTLGCSHRKYGRLGFLSGGLGHPIGFGGCSLESQRRPLNTICLQEEINRVENQESVWRKGNWVESEGFREPFLVLSGPSWRASLPPEQDRWYVPIHNELVIMKSR